MQNINIERILEDKAVMSRWRRATMRRIYTAWLLRSATRPFMVKSYILFVLLLQIISRVSVSDVLLNAPGFSDPVRNISFFSSAFFNTEAVVQLVTLGAGVVLVFFFRDVLGRSFQTVRPRGA